MKAIRRFKQIFIASLFVSFFFALLITRDIASLPYFDFTVYLPNTFEPFTKLWILFKSTILLNMSIFLSYFIPSSFVLSLLFFYKKDKKETLKRGQERVSAKELKKIIKKAVKKGYRLKLFKEKIPLPYNEENRGLLYLGKAGSGKTQAIYDFLFGSKKKIGFRDLEQTMIIYERKGDDFISKLYRENKDYLFDPRDTRSTKWNIFKDLKNDYNEEIDEAMLDFFAKSFQPISDNKFNHFEKQSQAIIKAILVKIAHNKNANNKMLIDYLLEHCDLVSLKNSLIKDINVQKYGLRGAVENALTTDSEGNANAQGSSVMATLNHIFRNLIRREFYFEDGDFSVREFISTIDKNPDKRLFIANTTETDGAYSSYFSLMFMLIFKYGRNLQNNSKRRVLLLLDECQSLEKHVLEELTDFLAESRSKGFVPIVATQSLPQLESLIDKKGMRALFQLLSTKVILQYDEPEGAKFLVDFFAENEIIKKKETESEAYSALQDRISFSEEEKLKKVVLPVELSTLKPLEAFVKIGNFPVSKVTVEYQEPQNICKPLIRANFGYFDTKKEIEI